jgi:NADH:ubiquinone oxidoreductase subunit 6 (subunit J)
MSIAFYLIAALTVAGGLAAVLLKNTVHCALALTCSLTRSLLALRRFWFISAR